MTGIPLTMKRLVVTAPGKEMASCKIEVQDSVIVPTPTSGQVLIKVAASAINPSDYSAWYRCNPDQCPLVMGSEGSGTVVKVGGTLTGLLSGVKVGSKVGFVNLKDNQGSYSEYVVADAFGGVFKLLDDDMPVEDAASFFVNPFTAIAIIESAKALGAKAFVHTAAASQLGQMIVKLAPSENIEIINVVRREEQAALLREIGAKHVVVTGGDNATTWKEELKLKVKELEATIAFDAIAGNSTGDMLDVLPNKGTVFIYGGLAGRAGNINPIDMIYNEKKIQSFLVTSWLKAEGILSTLARIRAASKNVTANLKEGSWASTQFVDTTLENAHADLIKLMTNKNGSTNQKMRVRMGNAD